MLGALAAPALGCSPISPAPHRTTAYILGVVCGGLAVWVFSSVLLQKPPLQMFIVGGGLVLFVGWTVAFTASLQGDSVRAGAAGLGLGLGAGFAAVMAATASLGQLGMALGAAAGGFLLVQMISAGASLRPPFFAWPPAAGRVSRRRAELASLAGSSFDPRRGAACGPPPLPALAGVGPASSRVYTLAFGGLPSPWLSGHALESIPQVGMGP